MRKDILDITKKLKEKDAHITIVSNGALLKRKEEILDHVDRMNISLHSTNQEIYETITNTKIPIQKIMQELALMKHKYPKVDFRVNATLVQNLQPEKEIQKMIEYIIENDLTLKYIELTPITAPGHMPIKSIIPLLLQRGFTQAKDEKRQMVFQRNNAKVMLRKCTCELVSELGEQQSYCKENSDINISPDGKISSCLIDTKKV
ncbi:MAG: radical SAM protein [bacterium]